MNLDLNTTLRTVVAGVVGLSITVPVGANLFASARGAGIAADRAAASYVAEAEMQDIKNNLTRACVDYRISKADSKMEREAKNTIDDYFDGEVSYKNICNYVLG